MLVSLPPGLVSYTQLLYGYLPGIRHPHIPRGIAEYGAGTGTAIAAAALFALGTVLQHEVASVAGAAGRLSLRALMSRPSWVIGQGATLAATVLQLVALSLAPVAIVQPVIAAGLIVALGVRAVRDRRPPTSVEFFGVGCATVGLAVFLVAAQPAEGAAGIVPGAIAVGVTVVVALTLVLIAPRAGRGSSGALACGSAAGIALAVAAVLAAAALKTLKAHGWSHLFAGPSFWGALVAAIAAAVASQQAFARGNLSWSLPALTVLDPLAAVPAARLLLGERLQPGHAIVWGPAALLAAVGVVVLARSSPAEHESPGAAAESQST